MFFVTIPECGPPYSCYFLLVLPLALLTLCKWCIAAHPWVREGGTASDVPLDISVLNNMREFINYSRLKQMALRVGSPVKTTLYC